jgi:hypothetical protein
MLEKRGVDIGTNQLYLVAKADVEEPEAVSWWRQTAGQLTGVSTSGAYALLAEDADTAAALVAAGIPAAAVAVDTSGAFEGGDVFLSKAQQSTHVAGLLNRPGGVTLYSRRRPVADEQTDKSLQRALDFWRRILEDLPLTDLNLRTIDRVIRSILMAA